MPFSHLSQILYELEKKSSLVTRALSAKSCARDTDSLHSCTRLRLVQEMACLYHSCKILPRKHSYPNLIPIFKWQKVQEEAFQQIKTHLAGTDSRVMTYFDPKKRTAVTTDASPVGIFAILEQEGKVIFYASRSLTEVDL